MAAVVLRGLVPSNLVSESIQSMQGHACCCDSHDLTGEGEEGMDSFIDHDMEDDMAGDETAPGSATRKRKGPKVRALYGGSSGSQPQAPIQPGATLAGVDSLICSSAMIKCMHKIFAGMSLVHAACQTHGSIIYTPSSFALSTDGSTFMCLLLHSNARL